MRNGEGADSAGALGVYASFGNDLAIKVGELF